MPTLLGHALLPLVVGKGAGADRPLLLTTAVCAMLPDLDSIGYFAGVPYGSAWGHRGATHSLVAALVVGLVVAAVARARGKSGWWWFAAAACAMASHPVLDALTSGGKGVALFWPFSETRWFLPLRPIPVSPMGAGVLSHRGVYVVVSELVLIGLPSLCLGATLHFARRHWASRSRRKAA